MIEDVNPAFLEPLTTYQVMKYCFEGCDWRRVFVRLQGCDKDAWTRTYHIYLDSIAWRKKSAERKKIDGDRCQHPRVRLCFNGGLQVHHLHYRNIGDEDVENDLITLCETCHAKEHDRRS